MNYILDYKFPYRGKTIPYTYKPDFEDICDCLRYYGDSAGVNFQGSDKDLWNMFVELGSLNAEFGDEDSEDLIYKIMSENEDWLKDNCRIKAQEQFEEEESYLEDSERDI